MTTKVEANEAIYSRFKEQWGDRTPFFFDNEKADGPQELPFVRLVTREVEGTQETLGAVGDRRFLRRATIIMQLFSDRNIGVKESDELITIARNIFEGTSFNGIWCFHGTIRELGITQDQVHQTNLEVRFDYEDRK